MLAHCKIILDNSSNNSVDHLTDLCKSHFEDANKIRLHRSKCTYIIKNILSPHFTKELRNDIANAKFSILIDETTDIGVIKLLGIVIIYFSISQQKIVSTYFTLAEVEESNSEGITKLIVSEINSMRLDIQNMLGIGTDNANVMAGHQKSVYTELKKIVPNLILIKCVCHSIQLAITNSWKNCMPSHLEFLVNETCIWFSRSYVRQKSYKHIFEAINDEQVPLKITNICDTRWLSIETSITRIIHQWMELKTHFGISKNYEKCFMAAKLYDLYKNNINFLYLVFLQPILVKMQTLNKSFQSQNADPTKLLNDMETVIYFLKQFVLNPATEVGIFSAEFESYVCYNNYLGFSFESRLKELKDDVDEEAENRLRGDCVNFVVHLILQLKKRLPENLKILKMVNLFSAENVLKQKKENIIPLLTIFSKNDEIIDLINFQYNNISYINWMEKTSTALLWSEVFNYKDSGGNNPFRELAEFALEILSLPWSNADVERVFSQLNLIKTKLRNRLITSTVKAVLHVRYGLKLKKKCCFDYEVPTSILRVIGTNASYSQNAEDWFSVFDT